MVPIWPSVLAFLGFSHGALCDGLRDFNADTPGKSYTPYTVAPGYFQVESDTFHITSMGDTQTIESFDPVLKYGLTNDVEIELQTNGFFNIVTRSADRTVSRNGFGDTIPAIKWNVFGNDGQLLSSAIRFGVKLPTASAGFGNGAVEFSLTAPIQVALPYSLSLQLQEEVDVLKNQSDTGKHFSYQEVASISRSFDKTSVSVEVFAQSGTDPNAKALYTADIGIGYAISSTTVISFGTYFGLNRFAPAVEGYTGFAFRF